MSQTPYLIGVDEVGRGPLAGPVMACAVFLPEKYSSRKLPKRCLQDSKVMTLAQREESYVRIMDIACYALGEASVEEIATLNIYHATLLAMKRAVETLMAANENIAQSAPEIWIDGNAAPILPYKTQTIIKGDAKVPAISAASIVAKVTRDRMMHALSEAHPEYGWEKNAGYGTKYHINAIRSHGTTSHHRSLFVRKILAAS